MVITKFKKIKQENNLIFFFSFLIISNGILAADVQEYFSPNSINKIYCEVIASDDYFDEDEYIIYADAFEEINTLVTFNWRGIREPDFTWYGDDVVEIKLRDSIYLHSYIYIFSKCKLISIDNVIDIFPGEEIIVYIESLSRITFISFSSDEVLQTITIDGITGVSLIFGGVRIEIRDIEILCISDVEPFTYKVLEIPSYFIFKKEF